MQEEKRKKFYKYASENPIKITNNSNFRNIVIEDLIFCGGDSSTYNEIWFLELSTNQNTDVKFINYEKENNRAIGLFNPKFTMTNVNRDEGSLLVFNEARRIDFQLTNEISIYLKNINDGNLIDTKDLNYLIIYSLSD